MHPAMHFFLGTGSWRSPHHACRTVAVATASGEGLALVAWSPAHPHPPTPPAELGGSVLP